jgi:hypothetical protein
MQMIGEQKKKKESQNTIKEKKSSDKSIEVELINDN